MTTLTIDESRETKNRLSVIKFMELVSKLVCKWLYSINWISLSPSPSPAQCFITTALTITNWSQHSLQQGPLQDLSWCWLPSLQVSISSSGCHGQFPLDCLIWSTVRLPNRKSHQQTAQHLLQRDWMCAFHHLGGVYYRGVGEIVPYQNAGFSHGKRISGHYKRCHVLPRYCLYISRHVKWFRVEWWWSYLI